MAKKNIIYSCFNDQRLFIVDYLKVNHDWDPVFFQGAERSRKYVEEFYPETVFQEDRELRKAKFNYSKIGSAIPIDAEIISALSKYELSCFNLLEDSTGWNFSFYERRRYYYDLLKYWNSVILNLKPDIYINFSWPHTVTDYTLYLLCKYYYDIPIIFIDAVPLFENQRHLFSTSMENKALSLRNSYNAGQEFNLQSEIVDYLKGVKSKKGKTPEYIQRSYREAKKYEKFQFKQFIKLILSTLVSAKGFKENSMAIKKNRLPFDSSKSQMSDFDYFWFKNRLRKKNRKLRAIYSSYCEQVDLKKKYVYFAAPYQPEAATCPSAGVYEDVFLMLDILSASIPASWLIYYKEHPGIFCSNLKGALARNSEFYRKLSSYKNIKIISEETDTFKLIDNSQAVATAVGTVAWESVLRGKPAMFFGNVWYQECKSLFKIKTLQDCLAAIEKIEKGYIPDQEDIERYVSAIQSVSVKGMIHRDFHERIKACSDPKFEMERIAEAFYEAYERQYGQNLQEK